MSGTEEEHHPHEEEEEEVEGEMVEIPPPEEEEEDLENLEEEEIEEPGTSSASNNVSVKMEMEIISQDEHDDSHHHEEEEEELPSTTTTLIIAGEDKGGGGGDQEVVHDDEEVHEEEEPHDHLTLPQEPEDEGTNEVEVESSSNENMITGDIINNDEEEDINNSESVNGTNEHVVQLPPPEPQVQVQIQAQTSSSHRNHQNPPPPKSQDVRVDNWGNYCLQRLQTLYERGDYCDLTLQFHTHQIIKVHRVVVNLCTEYFANLERLFGLTDGVLVLPKEVDYQAMLTIVRFLYSGKLEIREDRFNEIYRTVKLLNIPILAKLLEAHAKKPKTQDVVKKEVNRPMVSKQNVPFTKAQLSPGGGVQLTGTPVKFGGTTALSIQGAGGAKFQVTTPGVKLPPGVRTKTVLARVQPQGVRLAGQSGVGKIINQKKLPIWKERKFAPGDSLMSNIEKWPIKDEPARPTRFEWGEPEEDIFSLIPTPVVSLASHALMERQKSSPSSSYGVKKVEDIFDAVKSQTLGKRTASENSKSSTDHPPSKLAKVVTTPTTASDVIMTPLVHNDTDVDGVNLTDDTIEEEVSTTEANMHNPTVVKKQITILKPALKAQPTRFTTMMVGKNDPILGDVGKSPDSSSKSPVKSVRFAPEIEKENSKTAEGHTAEIHTDADPASNHSKIVAEILKKYPDLVKDKQNIKLKIVQKGSDVGSVKDKSKVSYIVLKSTSAPDSMGSVLLKKSNVTGGNKAFWDGTTDKEKKPSAAENTKGPWLCGPCGGGDEAPMEFESYYTYRRHLVEVHGERIDARICEYCGQKASKRNLLLYHLYTKHGVTPPKNIHFPNCDRCDYIALSESLLNKHKLTHDATKEFSCHLCNASFKSQGALQGHMSANLHRNKETKVYECPYCRKPFVRNINLKGHIRALHRDIARLEEMDDPRLPHDETLVARSTTNQISTLSTRKRQFPSILGSRAVPLEILPSDGSQGQQVSLVTADGHTIEILHGLDPNTMTVPMTLVPSSEAEAMTSVANSIAASLGLEQGVHGTTEFITGVPSDGSQVYIMDGSQSAVEVDMSSMSLAPEGTMMYEGEDPHHQGPFIVQDIHGNQFRKMTGIDETGKQVIFFQLSEEHTPMAIAPTILEDGIHQAASSSSSVFISSDISATENVTTDSTSQPSQVILTSSGHESIVYDLVSHNGQGSQDHVTMMTPLSEVHHETPSSTDEGQEHVLHHEETIHHQQIDASSVQQLHIVLDENDPSAEQAEEPVQQDEGEHEHAEGQETQLISETEVSSHHSQEEQPMDQQETQVIEETAEASHQDTNEDEDIHDQENQVAKLESEKPRHDDEDEEH